MGQMNKLGPIFSAICGFRKVTEHCTYRFGLSALVMGKTEHSQVSSSVCRLRKVIWDCVYCSGFDASIWGT